MTLRILSISLFMLVSLHKTVSAQSSVVGLLKSNLQQGKQHYEREEYEKALTFFNLVNVSKLDLQTQLKIARCHFFIKQYKAALTAYDKIISAGPLTMPDLLYYAELNTSVGNYPLALQSYTELLKLKPGEPALLQKIWQLNNIYLLYEDSLHYSVRFLPFNTQHAELSPVPFNKGIAFLSDRKEIDFKNPDQDVVDGLFNLYYAEGARDSADTGLNLKFKAPTNIGRSLFKLTDSGPVSYYADDLKCVLTQMSTERSSDGMFKKQLFFTERKNGKWTAPRSFEHNNKEYNLTDPSISQDGRMLLFSSDKPGGFGGNDIYKCEYDGERWSTPLNLGESINTTGNESFPFVYHNTLYFSSDGHPSLGGLDIHSVILDASHGHEVRNMGYPINSGADDFGLVMKNGSRGYFSSNRKNSGFDDDLYEFEMDFRTYPFDISGVIKISHRTDTTAHRPMSNVSLELIDYARSQVVAKTQTDINGGFSVTIPWFSKFALKLRDEEDETYIVSLEINRESSENSNYEIVVIKKAFNGAQKLQHESE